MFNEDFFKTTELTEGGMLKAGSNTNRIWVPAHGRTKGYWRDKVPARKITLEEDINRLRETSKQAKRRRPIREIEKDPDVVVIPVSYEQHRSQNPVRSSTGIYIHKELPSKDPNQKGLAISRVPEGPIEIIYIDKK